MALCFRVALESGGAGWGVTLEGCAGVSVRVLVDVGELQRMSRG